MSLVARVHAANGDAWQAQGRLREPWGGGVAEVRGLRLFASGRPHERWNTADAIAADADLEAARRWYAERGLPWGVRVPEGMEWPHGQRLFSRPLMALAPDDFRPAPAVTDLGMTAATPEDLDELALLDAAAYEDTFEDSRAWIEPHLHAPDVTTACARLGEELTGTGWALRTEGHAGPAVFIGGVAVAPHARRRGIGAAVSSWLVQSGLGAGAELAVLAPDTDEAARVYTRLGFARVTAYVIHTAPH